MVLTPAAPIATIGYLHFSGECLQVCIHSIERISRKTTTAASVLVVARTCLDAVGGAVEEADAADAVEDGVAAVLQHVVGADRWLTLPLSGEDGSLHHGEVLLVQHLGHVW